MACGWWMRNISVSDKTVNFYISISGNSWTCRLLDASGNIEDAVSGVGYGNFALHATTYGSHTLSLNCNWNTGNPCEVCPVNIPAPLPPISGTLSVTETPTTFNINLCGYNGNVHASVFSPSSKYITKTTPPLNNQCAVFPIQKSSLTEYGTYYVYARGDDDITIGGSSPVYTTFRYNRPPPSISELSVSGNNQVGNYLSLNLTAYFATGLRAVPIFDPDLLEIVGSDRIDISSDSQAISFTLKWKRCITTPTTVGIRVYGTYWNGTFDETKQASKQSCNGSLKVTVKDKYLNHTIPFAEVSIDGIYPDTNQTNKEGVAEFNTVCCQTITVKASWACEKGKCLLAGSTTITTLAGVNELELLVEPPLMTRASINDYYLLMAGKEMIKRPVTSVIGRMLMFKNRNAKQEESLYQEIINQ